MYKYAPYSWSRIQTYKQCPRKFKYQYIDKIPVEQKCQKALIKGKFIHSLLEHNGDINELKKSDDYKEIQKSIGDCITKQDIKEFYEIYKTFTNTELYKKLNNNKTLFTELFIALDEDLKIVPYDTALFRGYIDKVYVNPKTNKVYCIDWKTGKVNQKQTYGQLLFYSIGLFDKLPENIESIELVYVYVEHNKVQKKTVYRKDVEKYKKALLNTISKIEKDETFPKNESPLCDFCDFQELCSLDTD
jgi:CRISPR/Cas system-associated exonuclease Cas4 (RecB family)